jgi:hypothetical protein
MDCSLHGSCNLPGKAHSQAHPLPLLNGSKFIRTSRGGQETAPRIVFPSGGWFNLYAAPVRWCHAKGGEIVSVQLPFGGCCLAAFAYHSQYCDFLHGGSIHVLRYSRRQQAGQISPSYFFLLAQVPRRIAEFARGPRLIDARTLALGMTQKRAFRF